MDLDSKANPEASAARDQGHHGPRASVLKLGALVFVAYCVMLVPAGRLRFEHVLLAVLITLLAWVGPRSREALVALSGFVGVGWLYDAMYFVQHVGLTPDRIALCGLYEAERRWLGIDVGSQRFTVHDWFLAHHNLAADLFFSVPYGTFIYLTIAYALYLLVVDKKGAARFGWTFFLLNVVGFITYHLVPAAPPWYFHAHGCTVDLGAHASAGAALTRVDAALGIPYFASFYGRSSDVFGAIPSLHVAYPLMLVWETFRRHGTWARVAAIGYWIWMCCAAVYLDHHWFTDIGLGWLYALAALLLVYVLPDRLGRGAASAGELVLQPARPSPTLVAEAALTELLDRFTVFTITHRRRVIAVGIALILLWTPFAVALYANLRSAIEELLPRSAPSIHALDELHRRLGESLQMGLYASGPSTEKLHAFADALAERTMKLSEPPRLIDYRPREVQDFFLPRRVLFLDLTDLEELEQRVSAHIDHGRRSSGVFDLGLEEDEPAPPPLEEVLDHYKGRSDALKVFPSGYYDGADGSSLAMVFYPASDAIGYEKSRDFRDAIAGVAQSVAAEQGLTDLRLEYTGDVMAVIQEQRSLQADLLSSSVIVLVLEALLLIGFFRWRHSVPVLGLPLAVGTVVTLGISYLALGSLNASTAFLGSIIVGNGVNPGIILLARFVEERRGGTPGPQAMRTAVKTTALPTLVASAAAALSYGALVITDFRGYSQFGFMGLLGMTLCWIATYVWLPPVGVGLDALSPAAGPAAANSDPEHLALIDRLFARLGGFAVGRARLVVLVSTLLSVAAAMKAVSVGEDPYEHDTTRLRSSWATEPGGYMEVSRKMDAVLQRTTTPIVVLTATPDEVEPLAEKYRGMLKDDDPHLVLGSVMTLQSLVPADQAEKLAIVERIRKRLTPVVRSRLEDSTRELVDSWMPPEGLRPYAVRDLPEPVLRQFREKDGQLGRLVLLFAKSGSKTTDGRVVQKFASEVRSVPLPPDTEIAGSYLIFADMFAAIGRDGPVATVASLLGVMLLSLLLARGARGGMQVTVSLVVGVLWTVGIAATGGMRINFLNFIALPITFGIGVDYATNVYGRYRLGPAGKGEIVRAVSHSGAAVAACSATTVIGYSSLLLSRNGALFSFGFLAVLGELACLAAALLLLPAMLGLQLSPDPVATPLADATGSER